eukprot:11856608-Heterocapsa_arctica.AAC.1
MAVPVRSYSTPPPLSIKLDTQRLDQRRRKTPLVCVESDRLQRLDHFIHSRIHQHRVCAHHADIIH